MKELHGNLCSFNPCKAFNKKRHVRYEIIACEIFAYVQYERNGSGGSVLGVKALGREVAKVGKEEIKGRCTKSRDL